LGEDEMKKIGLVGGVGWPATALYYEALCRAADVPGGSPAMTIESLDMAETMAARGDLGGDPSWNRFDDFFRDALSRLQQSNCKVAAIASVTPHIRFKAICRDIDLPVIGIVEATLNAMLVAELDNARVLATPMVLRNGLFDAALSDAGISPGEPLSDEAVTEVGGLLDSWFYPGFGKEGREPLVEFAKRAIGANGTSTIVLACTDLAAAFPEQAGKPIFDASGLTWVNAAEAHVWALLAAAGHPERNAA
jgi:aspartate racemase